VNSFEDDHSYSNSDSEWVVLIVDDDADVIIVSMLAFSGICVDQRKIVLRHADSAQSEKNFLLSIKKLLL
jgi:hypothetical protein